MRLDVGQTVNTVANLGVIAGIVFLAMELNQNHALMRAQIRHEMSQGAIGFLSREASSPELADIVQRAFDGE